MKLLNLRLGHATNSSSSHSILVFKRPAHEVASEIMSQYNAPKEDEEAPVVLETNFGWDFFTASDIADKLQYLGIMLRESMPDDTPDYIVNLLLERMLGVVGLGGHIDHQSLIRVPSDYHSGYPDEQFTTALKEWMLREEVVIIGGNDNVDREHELESAHRHYQTDNPNLGALTDTGRSEWVCRHDELNDTWSLFERQRGSKIRIAFNDNIDKVENDEYPFAIAPELVDMKITDYCPYDCAFCVDPKTVVFTRFDGWVAIENIKIGDEIIAFDEYAPNTASNTALNTLDTHAVPDMYTVSDTHAARQLRYATVKNKRTVETEAYKVTFPDGREIITSLDHKWLNGEGAWREARMFKEESTFKDIGVFNNSLKFGAFDLTYMRGYIAGLSIGGVLYRPKKSDLLSLDPDAALYWRVLLEDLDIVTRVRTFLGKLHVRIDALVEQELEGGRRVYGVYVRAHASLEKLKDIMRSQDDNKHWQRGFVAALFDALGSFDDSVIRISQKIDVADLNIDALNLWREIVESYDFNVLDENIADNGKLYGQLNGQLSGLQLYIEKEDIYRLVEWFNIFQPASMRKYIDLDGKMPMWDTAKCVKLEKLQGTHKLIDIETSTGTFFANGFATHNCYQGSTAKGIHARDADIRQFLDALSDLKVFEVAIGGGEPTLHPDFLNILAYADKLGINANFTTKNTAWLRNPKNIDYVNGKPDTTAAEQQIKFRESVLTHAKAFAVSVDNAAAIYDLHQLLIDEDLLNDDYNKRNLVRDSRVNVHIVMGTIERDEFKAMLHALVKTGLRATLLGYKETGRGCDFSRIDYDWWLEDTLEAYDVYRRLRLNIDTVLASQYTKALEDASVYRWTYATKDGTYSAYIDAVAHTFAPSSYVAAVEHVAIPDDVCKSSYSRGLHSRHYTSPKLSEWLQATFQKWNQKKIKEDSSNEKA